MDRSMQRTQELKDNISNNANFNNAEGTEPKLLTPTKSRLSLTLQAKQQ